MSAQDQTKMFKNPILELLSKSNPPMMICFHLILTGSFFYIGIRKNIFKSEPLIILGFFALGLITWTLTEYLMHRYVFHFEKENKLIKAFHYAMHGHHHENPKDREHMFMPPLPSFIFVMIFFGLFYILIGQSAFYFLPGFEIGYLIYSLIHFYVHNHVASKGIMKNLWMHHAKHHYQTPEKAFGVSSTFWDWVFNTMPTDKKSTQETTS
jgi:sterol desaturase/sphingolipid hydroxylase (fatty acid hydroxylase superfamily)